MIDYLPGPHRAGFLAAVGVVVAAALIGYAPYITNTDAGEQVAAVAKLVLHDDRLQLSLFAEDPDIVTPIGLAIDERDRLYVL